jgi:hypothetical protein
MHEGLHQLIKHTSWDTLTWTCFEIIWPHINQNECAKSIKQFNPDCTDTPYTDISPGRNRLFVMHLFRIMYCAWSTSQRKTNTGIYAWIPCTLWHSPPLIWMIDEMEYFCYMEYDFWGRCCKGYGWGWSVIDKTILSAPLQTQMFYPGPICTYWRIEAATGRWVRHGETTYRSS